MNPQPPITKKIGKGTPPGLLLATLTFWGWQSDWLWLGLGMGLILDLARFLPLRWELGEDDFRRIWNFCLLLALGLLIYNFSVSDAGPGPAGTLQTSARKLGFSGLDATNSLLRMMPVIWFVFVAAQMFSARQLVPLAAISWLARRWQRRQSDQVQKREVNISYPYFMIALYSSGLHSNSHTHWYFLGQCSLLVWALWPFRRRQTSVWLWGALLAVGLAVGYVGTRSIGRLEVYLNNYNAQWMARLLRPKTVADLHHTSIGQIGLLKLSDTIVIRVEPQTGVTPSYLREASFCRYNSQVWQTTGGLNDFNILSHEATNENNWLLLPGQTNLSSAEIACYLNGRGDSGNPEDLLPLPSGTARLENLPAYTLQKNPFGAVLAEGPGLVIFQAQFGGRQTLDAPPNTNFDITVLSASERTALEQVTKEIGVTPAMTDAQKLLAAQKFFTDKFTYSLFIPPDFFAHSNGSPLEQFLLRHRSGYCEYFASATVLLLRSWHIPARYAIGYAVHERSGHGLVVRERDAHAWCLVWDAATRTWRDFDTTPSAEEKQPLPWLHSLSDAWSWLRYQFKKIILNQGNIRQYAFWLLIPVLGLSVYQFFFRRGRQRRKQNQAGKGLLPPDRPGLDSEFYRLETRLAARGVPRLPGESLAHWLERVLIDPALADWRAPLRELLRLHYQYRFDPNGLAAADRARLSQEVQTCLKALDQPAPKQR